LLTSALKPAGLEVGAGRAAHAGGRLPGRPGGPDRGATTKRARSRLL